MWRAGEKEQALIQCSESHGGAPDATTGGHGSTDWLAPLAEPALARLLF